MLAPLLLLGCSPDDPLAPSPRPFSLTSDSEWTAQVEQQLLRQSRQLRLSPDGHAHYTHVESAMRLSSTERGTRIRPWMRDGSQSWSIEIRVTGLGRGSTEPVEPGDAGAGDCVGDLTDATGTCVHRMERSLAEGVIEWWTNTEQGLRQGWILESEPSGTGPLVLDVVVDGMTVGVLGPDAVQLTNAHATFEYADLHAWDAHGQALEASIEPTVGGLQIRVEIDGAAFPVTVDPLATNPDWVDDGPVGTLGSFGRYLDGVGDLNADGFDDIAIAAANLDTVFLYAGSAGGLPNVPTWVRVGEFPGDFFGNQLSRLGDVNDDGFDDLTIGAVVNSEGGANAGKIYVFHGSIIGPSAVPLWTLLGAADDRLGATVGGAGDVNGDGFDDLLVAATGHAALQGRAWVYLGGASGIGGPAVWSALGPNAQALFGHGGVGIGDVNGDGFGDIAVPATPGVGGDFQVFAYYGSAVGPAMTPSWSAIGNGAVDHFGEHKSIGHADVNGDGFDDLVVGARADGSGGIGGKAYVFRGSSGGLAATPSWTFAGAALSSLGSAVAGAGDVNSDGYEDVLIGASNADQGFSEAGLVHLFLGSPAGLSDTPAWTGLGDQADAYFGDAVAGAGDVNGDGFPDVLIGAYPRDTFLGRASVFYGMVPNGPPIALADGPYSGVEGAPIAVDGSSSFDPDGTVVAWRWDCDSDGSVDATGQTAFCVLPDNGTYTLTLEVEDAGGAVGTSAPIPITTINADPLVDLGGDITADEGTPVQITAQVTDPGTDDVLSYEVSCGFAFTATPSTTFSCTFPDDGIYTVQFRATDDDGGTSTDSIQAVVANVPPTVDLGPDRSGAVGESFFFSCVTTDPGTDSLLYTYDCGAGAGPVASPFSVFFCSYPTDGGYTASCSADDGDGGIGTDTAHVAVGYLDGDGDTYEAVESGGDDCDDDDPNIHPGASDGYGDGIDQNCDGWDGHVLLPSQLTPGSLDVVEIMDNPFSGPAATSRWFELRNSGGLHPVNLDNLRVVAGGTTLVVTGTVAPIAPGALAVVGVSATANGGVSVDIELPGMTSTSSVILQNVGGTVLGSLIGSGFVGSSTSVDALGQSCIGRTFFGDGDFGTPGEVNPSCDFTLDAHYTWHENASFFAEGDVLVSFTHVGASFSTDNAGVGLGWYLVSDTAGQTLSFTYETTNVTWSGTRAFGEDCWTLGSMSNLPAGYTGAWTGCGL